ncbi:MAG: substrate-binding domain-containing protein [Muricomes sp.]|uniref:sugar ABC transporter substrate-binding protein n=1 Tax=Faecalicatena contorta TaxID=39482 RepID=UPI002ECDA433|nr:substrate-binding domain-containing protein [Muricomes sp.]
MKKMKKILALLLTAMMVLSMAAGCSGKEAEGGAGEKKDAAKKDGDKPLIGVMFYSNTDALGSQTYELINTAAETLGAETLWEVGNFDNDSQLAAIQNLIAAGVDGLLFQPMDYDFLPKVIDLCEEAEVYLGVMFGPIQSQETVEYMAQSDYFVGYSYEDEGGNAEKLVDYLYEAGRTELGVGYATPGNALADWANEGFDKKIEEHKMNVLAEYSNPLDNNVNTVSSNVQNFLSAYPDMNGMVFGGMGGGAGEAITQLLVDSKRDVKIVGRDIFEGMDKAFDAGVGAAFCGAVAPDGLYMLSCVYNAIQGNPVSDSYVELIQPALFITSSEECKLYEDYVNNTDNYTSVIFDKDYYLTLSKAENPELDPETIQGMMDTYNFEWISQRVGEN